MVYLSLVVFIISSKFFTDVTLVLGSPVLEVENIHLRKLLTFNDTYSGMKMSLRWKRHFCSAPCQPSQTCTMETAPVYWRVQPPSVRFFAKPAAVPITIQPAPVRCQIQPAPVMAQVQQQSSSSCQTAGRPHCTCNQALSSSCQSKPCTKFIF
ncbi:unnamed protein product [Enterobius vermicularis]|uniref:Phlebovirus_G2 domain-containing protein n=1 Tax=Enterobius vermicularis TaxID=51028 RepID=A0A0N4VRM5_ENTVE|nr:unnamed protein product [Enterobius vermicularis]